MWMKDRAEMVHRHEGQNISSRMFRGVLLRSKKIAWGRERYIYRRRRKRLNRAIQTISSLKARHIWENMPYGQRYHLIIQISIMKPVESVAQSKSTRCQKPKLSTIERGHRMDVWPLCARLCARPEISPELNSLQTLQKSLGWGYKARSPPPPPPPPVYVCKN